MWVKKADYNGWVNVRAKTQEERINEMEREEGERREQTEETERGLKELKEEIVEEEAQAPDILDDDYVIADGRGGKYEVAKIGFSSPEMYEIMWAIARDMEANKVFPDVWYVNDHGNVDLLALDIKDDDLTFRVVKSWV